MQRGDVEPSHGSGVDASLSSSVVDIAKRFSV